MSKRLDSTILQELQYAVNRILFRTQSSTLAEFLRDEDLQDIVLRQLLVAGEAAARVSEVAKQRYSQIDWRRMAGMRNFIADEYFRLDFPIIWDVIENHLPPLAVELPDVLTQVLADEQSRQAPGV